MYSTDVKIQIAKRIKLWRWRRGLTQEQLAHKAFDSERQVVSELELGKGNPTMDTYCNLAEALQVDVRAFFDRWV